MTENDWLTGTDPLPMLLFLFKRTTVRKLRLFTCAAIRQQWEHLHDERSRKGVEVSERYADGRASDQERRLAETAAAEARDQAPWYETRQAVAALWTLLADITCGAARILDDVPSVSARLAALEAARNRPWYKVRMTREEARQAARERLCDLLREVYGNPFTPTAVQPRWLIENQGIVQRLAQCIYNEKRFEDLPILADALEESGCQDVILLSHCRANDEHVLGCWAVDVLLGQE